MLQDSKRSPLIDLHSLTDVINAPFGVVISLFKTLHDPQPARMV
tara:strand:- start:959 stop:1090 length:132 start_codon:yes stop_codon:yes gene_type:complete